MIKKWTDNNESKTTNRQHSTYCRAGLGGTPTADSRFAVPRPSDRNALRNPPRQHVPNRWHYVQSKRNSLNS